MGETFENEQAQTIRELLVEWLGRENWKPQELIDWLQSYGLPISSEEHAFIWLLRALPEDELYPAKKRLASRVAAILELNPDDTLPEDEADQVLFNLFYLCAGLAFGDELADPLYAVYQRGKRRDTLRGKWSGINLRDALRAALTTNQIDARLESVWHGMLEGNGDDFLPGDAEDGFEGLAFMPRSREERGEPAWGAIALGLDSITRCLENDANRRTELRNAMARVRELYPGPDSDEFIRIAHEHQWPRWAVESIPSLVITSQTETNSVSELVWSCIVDCIPADMPYKLRGHLCGGEIADVELSERARNFVEGIASVFERNRLANPFFSERAAWGVVIASIIESRIDVRSARIAGKLSLLVGGYGEQELFEVIAPAVAVLKEADTPEEDLRNDLRQIASDCHFPQWALTYVEHLNIAA